MIMTRRKKSSGGAGGMPAWLITFSDLMTLLLTFFVLLVSMAVIDQRSKLVVLSSVSTSFGIGQAQFNPKSPENKSHKFESGAMVTADMDHIRDMLWEDNSKDLDFQENKYVQILSISGDVLFQPGETTLSDQGIVLLNKLTPYLVNIKYPLLVAGHTANRRDEEEEKYAVSFDAKQLDSTWPLSLGRAQTVYRYLVQNGFPSSRLNMEAFGQYHPRFPDATSEGRMKNRRVDIVLDKRNAPEILGLEQMKTPPRPLRHYFFHGFFFDLGNDAARPAESQGGG